MQDEASATRRLFSAEDIYDSCVVYAAQPRITGLVVRPMKSFPLNWRAFLILSLLTAIFYLFLEKIITVVIPNEKVCGLIVSRSFKLLPVL